MAQSLINLGCVPRKSLIITLPDIPKNLMHHFIRGYFDGDGCIMRLKGNRVNSAFTCGSRVFLEELLKILKEKAGVIGGSFDDSCCSLKFGKRDTFKLGQFMYQNDPELFLERKRKKFE